MMHRDCKEAIRLEYHRLHEKYPTVKSTIKLSISQKYVRVLALAYTVALKVSIGGAIHDDK